MINKTTILLPIRLLITLYFLTFCFSCQSYITFTVEDGSGPPLSTDNTITVTLDNPYIKIQGVQMDICDEGDYLTCTGCETTERTPDFLCETNELENGCCRMILVSLTGDSIEAGTGPIFTLSYDISDEAPIGECRDLNPEGVKILDKNIQPIDIKSISITGEFCFDSSMNSTTTAPSTTTPPPTPTGPVTVIIGNGSGFMSSLENPIEISLDNPDNKVKGVEIDICDVDDYLTCTGCITTDRTSGFTCVYNELRNGCCRVVLLSFDDYLIEKGTGPILTLRYDVSEEAPGEECRYLNPENAKVADEFGNPLDTALASGEFCFEDNDDET